tara:strand:- start:1931 stop:2353 length:423 start_codon:yes stop_codon:yes gene_type:complete
VLNVDVINHEFPGGSLLINHKINDLINLSTGNNKNSETNNIDSHQIFSMIALNSIGYTLDEFFKYLNFDVNKGPMLGQCDINFYNSLQIDKKYNVKGRIISIDYKKSKKIGEIDIVKFIVEIFFKKTKVTNIEYTLILPR